MPATPPPFDLTRAREAFGNAGSLHGEATRRGAAALTSEDFDALRAADEEFMMALREGRIEDAIRADDRFHQVLLTRADDPDLQVSVDLLSPRLRRMDLWLFTRKAFGGHAPSSHPPIIAALERGDAETAAKLVEASFLEAGEQLAMVLERRSEPARE